MSHIHLHFPSVTRTLSMGGATLLVLSLMAACSPADPVPAPPPKPVKVETVSSGTNAGSDSFVGTVRALQRTDLSFETPGRVASIEVDVGSRVRRGQVLASLDDQPAQLRLAKAQADLAAALAQRSERQNALRQQEALAQDHIISATALQAVQASAVQAVSQVDAADAAVRAAQRELSLSRITAPFDGEVVTRTTQPHADVATGQAVFAIESGRELELVAMLPEQLASRLSPGLAAQGNAFGEPLALTLKSVSARADNGSLVQTIFRIDGKPRSLRSGSVVSLELSRSSTAAAVSVPATALMPSATAQQASVFVLDSTGSTLVRRDVRTASLALLPGGRIAIADGLALGDRVVVAGTPFLTEGQRVVVQAPQTLLQESRP